MARDETCSKRMYEEDAIICSFILMRVILLLENMVVVYLTSTIEQESERWKSNAVWFFNGRQAPYPKVDDWKSRALNEACRERARSLKSGSHSA